MKKNDYFIDVSAYQPADLTAICQASGTQNTIIKITEGTSWISDRYVGQTNTSHAIGYYHFARFSGNVALANQEAQYFISHVPKKVKYLVVDYESDASPNKQANTDAVLAFMDRIAENGYSPIYYSYKPFTLSNIDHTRILAKYPNSLWIAAYPNYNVTPDPVWSVFPSMDGIRWWQFTSTGIPGKIDKNVVLLDDDFEKEETMEEEDMFTISAEGRGIALMQGGKFLPILDPQDPPKIWEAGVKHVQLSPQTFDEWQGSVTFTRLDDETVNKLLADRK